MYFNISLKSWKNNYAGFDCSIFTVEFTPFDWSGFGPIGIYVK